MLATMPLIPSVQRAARAMDSRTLEGIGSFTTEVVTYWGDSDHMKGMKSGWWARATPLKNMSSSIGMIIATQYIWENKKWQPNHQPEMIFRNIKLVQTSSTLQSSYSAIIL